MGYFLFDFVEHLSHKTLVELEATNTLILTEEEILGLLVKLPVFVIEHAFLEFCEIVYVVAIVYLFDFMILTSLLSCFFAPISIRKIR